MSSLIFYTDENQAFVATDTLAVSQDGKPAIFTTKSFLVPHLRMIICGTGISGLLGRWFVQINDHMLVRGIDHLDYHVPTNLAALWRSHKEDFSIPDNVTTTVYHFGFSEEQKVIHSFAYRSVNNFQSESIPYGLAVKPECSIPENWEFPKDIKTMMEAQITMQASLPATERLYIGGEIQVCHLTSSGFHMYTLDRFDDYVTHEQAMYQNFASSKS